MNFRNSILGYASLINTGEIIAGGTKDRKIAEEIRASFEALNLDSKLIPFQCMNWTEKSAFIEYKGEVVNALALPYTPSGDIEAEIVYVGTGYDEEDWEDINVEDKIVLLEWFKDRVDDIQWQYMSAVKRGAVAVIVYDAYPNVLRRMVITAEEDYRWKAGTPPPVPALTIQMEDGMRLVKAARSRGRVRVYSETEVKHDATSYIIEVGEPGGIILTAHYDKWLTGFMDDTLGVLTVFKLAEEFRENISYAIFGAEESGAPGYSPWYWIWGSRNYVKRLKERGSLDKIVAVINIDAIGREPIAISASGPDFLEPLKQKFGEEFKYTLDLAIFDSFSFSMEGVPALTIHSFYSLSEIYHTNRDTVGHVNWVAVEKAYSVIKEVLSILLEKGTGFFNYNALTRYIYNKLKPVSDKEYVKKFLEKIEKISPKDEGIARDIRRKLIKPLYEGKYNETHGEFITEYVPQLNLVNDIKYIQDAREHIRKNEFKKALRLIEEIPNYRVVPGEERILPYINIKAYLNAINNEKRFLHILRELENTLNILLIESLEEVENILRYSMKI